MSIQLSTIKFENERWSWKKNDGMNLKRKQKTTSHVPGGPYKVKD